MPLIERYILRRTTHAFLLTLGALVGTLWLAQILRVLDVVTAKGQAIWVLLVMTTLALPALAQVVAPVAFLVGALITLNALTSDSELPVISGAGASRRTVNRPILMLAAFVVVGVSISHHILAPASLSALRVLVTKIRADVIATLVQDGGFRSVDEGVTMHIRNKAPDGSFRDIFVNDDRDPTESLQYTATQGTVLERDGGSFLVMQNGELIRETPQTQKHSVVAFETYALDLSQLGTGSGAAFYKARERSTFYLMEPEPDDAFSQRYPERVAAEIHDRITAPLYPLVFAFVALAFLGRPRTNRQDRSFALAMAVLVCVLLRAAGFAAVAAASASGAAVPLMYLIPAGGIVFGLYATMRDVRLRIPRPLEAVWDRVARTGERTLRRWARQPAVSGGESP